MAKTQDLKVYVPQTKPKGYILEEGDGITAGYGFLADNGEEWTLNGKHQHVYRIHVEGLEEPLLYVWDDFLKPLQSSIIMDHKDVPAKYDKNLHKKM